MGLGEIRVKFDGLAEAGAGLVQLALDSQHQAQFAVGHGEIRVELDGLFQALDGLVQLALASLRIAEVYPGGIVLGPQSAGRVERGDPQAVLGPDTLQAKDEGQFEVGRIPGAGRRQPRYRVQSVALHERRQHTQRRHGRAGGISVRRQFLDRIPVAPHGRVAKAICPRTGIGSTRRLAATDLGSPAPVRAGPSRPPRRPIRPSPRTPRFAGPTRPGRGSSGSDRAPRTPGGRQARRFSH